MTEEEIIDQIELALSDLYEYEFDLIEIRAEEEAISAQLICYLKPRFGSWNVDVEYNRDGKDPKENSDGVRIFPDIIIHRRTPDREERNSPENNLVAIEVKGYWNPKDRGLDREKLIAMKERYGYQYLFQIELKKEYGDLIKIEE